MVDRLIVLKCSKGYRVVNLNNWDTDGKHGHFYTKKAANTLMELMQKNVVPDSDYFRHSVLLITQNRKYKERVARKIRKDSNKSRYFNVNCGVMAK